MHTLPSSRVIATNIAEEMREEHRRASERVCRCAYMCASGGKPNVARTLMQCLLLIQLEHETELISRVVASEAECGYN
jgi:hypothetical protein